MNGIILYSNFWSNRLAYVCDFIFHEVLKMPFEYTTFINDFQCFQGFKIAYTHEVTEADLHIQPQGLLAEEGIKPQQITLTQWHELPVFFQQQNSDIPFDLFSAVFYLVSRYEEYLPFEPDTYQRFPHELSLAFRKGFLQLPLVDLWLLELKKLISLKHPNTQEQQQNFLFIPTYDIDIAYSYIGKNFIRQAGGAVKDLLRGNYDAFLKRQQVQRHRIIDPYDSYALMDQLHDQYALQPIYFFLAGENGKFDKNIPFESPVMQKLIQRIADRYRVGIHPSYGSHSRFSLLQQEVSKIPTGLSRQHYIRFTLPHTFRELISAGIKADYSMGYGSINGFRASTSFSFLWFDVEKDQPTTLRIHPFCFMECNSFFEQKLSASEALQELKHYLQIVRKVNGQLITIWHNFSLGNDPLWQGWKEVYETFLSELHK